MSFDSAQKGSIWTWGVSHFLWIVVINRYPNDFKVISGLLHVPLATSLKWFDELLSAFLHDLDVCFPDGVVLSLYIVFRDFAVVFIVGFLLIELVVFPQYFIAMLLILLDNKPEVLDLPLDSQLLLLVLRRCFSWSRIVISIHLALWWLELPPSRDWFGFIWLLNLRVLFAILIYFYTLLVHKDWTWGAVQMNSSYGIFLMLQVHFVFGESRVERLRFGKSSDSCLICVFLLISNAAQIVRRLWYRSGIIHV